MKLGILVVVAVLALGAVVYLQDQPSTSVVPAGEPEPLVPALADDVNAVTGLTVIAAGGEAVATLERGDDTWVVSNKGGYPANMARVRETLLTLSQAKLIEAKTRKVENYGVLGVEAVDEADASGVLVELQGLGEEPLGVIIGNGGRAAGGNYVRLVDQAQSWLSDQRFNVPDQASQWLDRQVVDLADDRVQRVAIRHPDGGVLTVEKTERDQGDFIVLDLPPERELRSATVANPMGRALAALQLEDVAPAAEVTWPEEVVEAEFRTFDGLVVTVAAAEGMAEGEESADQVPGRVRFTVAFDEAQARRFAPAAEVAEGEGEEDAVSAGDRGDLAEALARGQQEAEELQARLGDWVYTIPRFKYDNLVKTLDELLAPLADESQEDDAS
ncbi:MAG: DUF4340 domain-containing protein [Candidatus Competibacterales bacterium]